MKQLKRVEGIVTRLQAQFWKSLEKPLRFDEVSNERRLARMGIKRIELAQWVGLVLTFVNFFATPAWEIVEGGPWEGRWRLASLGSGVAVFVLLAYMHWQGRPLGASEELRREAEGLEAQADERRNGS